MGADGRRRFPVGGAELEAEGSTAARLANKVSPCLRWGRGVSPASERLTLALIVALVLLSASATDASASLDPQEALTYIPNGFVHNTHSAAEVEEILAAARLLRHRAGDPSDAEAEARRH